MLQELFDLESGERVRQRRVPCGGRLGHFAGGMLYTLDLSKRPGAPCVVRVDPATGEETRLLSGRVGGETVLAGVSVDGARVALASRKAGRLDVFRAADGERVFSARHFRQPGDAPFDMDVTFAGPVLLYHTRPPDKSGGGDYRLRAHDLDEDRELGHWGAWVSHYTPHYVVAGGTLIHGEDDYRIVARDLAAGTSRTLFTCFDELYSHWLELTLAPKGDLVVAWSVERDPLCCYDLKENRRFEVEGGGALLGLAPEGRVAYLADAEGLRRLDLATKMSERIVALQKAFWDLAPGARRAVARFQDTEGRWRLRIHRVP